MFGDRRRAATGESTVFVNSSRHTVVKVRNPFAKAPLKHLRAADVIYEHLVHNILFPNARYTFVGIGEENGEVRVILSQQYIPNVFRKPLQTDIERYLAETLCLAPEDRYFFSNDYVAVTDVSATGDNVLYTDNTLYFIDPLIRLKRPALDVLAYYYKLSQ